MTRDEFADLVERVTERAVEEADWSAPLADRYDSFEVLMIVEEGRQAAGPPDDLGGDLQAATLADLHAVLAPTARG